MSTETNLAQKVEDIRAQAEEYRKHGIWQKALPLYENLVDKNPHNWRAHVSMADIYLELEQWTAAAKSYKAALKIDSDFDWAWHNLSIVLFNMNDLSGAIGCYEKLQALNPLFWDTNRDVSIVKKYRGIFPDLLVNESKTLTSSFAEKDMSDSLSSARLRSQDELFNYEIYRELYEDISSCESEDECYQHWLRYGREEGRVASIEGLLRNYSVQDDLLTKFDWKQYLNLNPDLAQDVENEWQAIIHYAKYGQSEGRQYSTLQEVPKSQSTGLSKVVNSEGKNMDSSPTSESALRVQEDIAGLLSEAFDEKYYLENNPDVANARVNALEHYLTTGFLEGRDPNPLFDSSFYCETNKSELKDGFNPLAHYIIRGYREGKDPNPLFSSSYYLQKNTDVANASINPLIHYMQGGEREGRRPNPLFDPHYYLKSNPDVAKSGVCLLAHYLKVGCREGRDPNPDFSSEKYLELHPEIRAHNVNPLAHYLYDNHTINKNYLGLFDQGKPSVSLRDWRNREFTCHQLASLKEKAFENFSPKPPKIFDFSASEIEERAKQLRFSSEADPKVSIIVPVFNQIKFTIECLWSVKKYTTNVSYEVVLMDDASTDSSERILSQIEGIVYVRNSENMGFLLSCNRASTLTRGQYIVLLNNDVQVASSWLLELLEVFRKYKNVGVVGPKVLYPSGYLQEAGIKFNRDGSSELIGLNQDPELPRYNYVREVDSCSGACLLFKKSLFKALGGFDQRYAPAYFEDADFALKVRSKGLKVYYTHKAEVVHHLSISFGNESTPTNKSQKMMLINQNKRKFIQRWHEKLELLNQIRLITFYLPQFHAIPENDRWWGKGFTEWRNTSKAQPNYKGHYQPHMPSDLGFYDISGGQTMEEQFELARKYSIHGFCYYYYWFNGKRLLEKPIERMIASKKEIMPFCLAWANENWTRRWNGQSGVPLMTQAHSDEDDEACIQDLLRYLVHPNYIRINGKPLLIIYRSNLFPDIRRTLEIWRNACISHGLGEIYLAHVESFEFATANVNPGDYGFDASIEFPPHNIGVPAISPGDITNNRFDGAIYDYRQVPLTWFKRGAPNYTRFPGVMPSWDNTARQQDKGTIFEYASPGIYQAWLEEAISQTLIQNFGEERIVFVNAWNEWAEGAHLEPDLKFGHRWLEATKNALDRWMLV